MKLYTIRNNYGSDGECWRCPFCHSKKLNQEATGFIDAYMSQPCEIETRCVTCGKVVNFWAYGGFDPIFQFYDRSLPALINRITHKLKGPWL